MASFMTVKRLRAILSDASLDEAIVMLEGGRKLCVGTGPSAVNAVIDFQTEELKPTGYSEKNMLEGISE